MKIKRLLLVLIPIMIVFVTAMYIVPVNYVLYVAGLYTIVMFFSAHKHIQHCNHEHPNSKS